MSWKSSAEPLARREVEIRLQRYEEFSIYANNETKLFKINNGMAYFLEYRCSLAECTVSLGELFRTQRELYRATVSNT